jgi:hypothetical protein
MKVLRSDNGTDNGIVHQTMCVSTPEQNGIAKKKNRHILEVTRCLLFVMNILKYL